MRGLIQVGAKLVAAHHAVGRSLDRHHALGWDSTVGNPLVDGLRLYPHGARQWRLSAGGSHRLVDCFLDSWSAHGGESYKV